MSRFLVILLIIGIGFLGSDVMAKQRVVAQLYDQVITADELDDRISNLPREERMKYSDRASRLEYLEQIAEAELLSLTARKRGKNNVEELIRDEVDKNIVITDLVLQKYYNEHENDYVTPEQVGIIEVTVKSGARAAELLGQIEAGADFSELAKRLAENGESIGPGCSKGGRILFTKKSFSIHPTLIGAAFGCRIGEISGIVTWQRGNQTCYTLFTVYEYSPAIQRMLSEENVKRDVEEAVWDEKRKQSVESWLSDLKAESGFRLYPENVRTGRQTASIMQCIILAMVSAGIYFVILSVFSG